MVEKCLIDRTQLIEQYRVQSHIAVEGKKEIDI